MATVLVVDDYADIADALAAMTELVMHCDVVAAYDGATALRLVQEREIDLIVLDCHMPGLSGLDVLRRLHNAGQPKSPPVIFHSADDSAEHEAMELGAVAFVSKGNRSDVLLGTMAKHMPLSA